MSAMAGGTLDLFYIYKDAEATGLPDLDGDGIGVRAEADLGNNISFTGLHQSSDLDGGGLDASLRETRIGLKYSHALEAVKLTGEVEHVNLTLRVDGLPIAIGDDVELSTVRVGARYHF